MQLDVATPDGCVHCILPKPPLTMRPQDAAGHGSWPAASSRRKRSGGFGSMRPIWAPCSLPALKGPHEKQRPGPPGPPVPVTAQVEQGQPGCCAPDAGEVSHETPKTGNDAAFGSASSSCIRCGARHLHKAQRPSLQQKGCGWGWLTLAPGPGPSPSQSLSTQDWATAPRAGAAPPTVPRPPAALPSAVDPVTNESSRAVAQPVHTRLQCPTSSQP